MAFQDTYQLIHEKMAGKAARTDLSKIGNLTVEVLLTGEGGGTFYASVKNGEFLMEPTACLKKDLSVQISAEDFLDIVNRRLNPMTALAHGKIKTKGNLTKVLQLKKLL